MILDHVSMAAIRPLKFTNKNSIFLHADSGKFFKFRKEQLVQLTSELYFHFVEKKTKQKKTKCKIY